MNQLNKLQLNKLRLFWNKHGEAILAYGLVPVSENSMGIGANTYRVYGRFIKQNAGNKPKPGVLFSNWAKKQFKKYDLACTSDFVKFHHQARRSLESYWKGKAKKNIEVFPYVCKLIDLHVKHIVWHGRDMSKLQRARLLKSAFQPLDQHSLLCLRQFNVQLRDKKIPKTASMGLVDQKGEYLYLQHSIREICKQAKVPVFAFDHFAWNSRL